jgi:hypothetical protein
VAGLLRATEHIGHIFKLCTWLRHDEFETGQSGLKQDGIWLDRVYIFYQQLAQDSRDCFAFHDSLSVGMRWPNVLAGCTQMRTLHAGPPNIAVPYAWIESRNRSSVRHGMLWKWTWTLRRWPGDSVTTRVQSRPWQRRRLNVDIFDSILGLGRQWPQR